MAAATHFQTVQKIYIAFYQRPADPAGLKYWADRIDVAGGDASAVVAAFANSPEAVALYGTIDATTIGSVVDKIYMALFNKAPDAAGKQFYVDGFNAGTFTPGTIALNILNGAMGDDAVAVNNKAQVANSFTQQVDGRALNDVSFGTGSSFNATYKGDADATAARDILKNVTSSPATVLNQSQVNEEIKTKIADATDPIMGQTGGQTFTLTVNQDSGPAFTGGNANDVFTAAAAQDGAGNLINTLQNVDVLDGGAGMDTLNVTQAAAGVVAPSIKNIETINVRFAGAGTLGLANATGVTSVNVADSTTGGVVSATGAIDSISVKNQVQNVGFDGTTAAALNLSLQNFGTAAAANNVNLGTTVAAKATTLNVAVDNVYATVNSTLADVATTLNVAATGTNALAFTDSAATAKAVTVTGTGSVDMMGAAFTAALTSFDASANEGGIKANIQSTAAAAVKGGSGKDVFDMDTAVAANTTVDLGAGDDAIYVGNLLGSFKSINGGDGIDTINITNAASWTALTSKLISNFETLDVSGGQGAYDVSLGGFTTVQINEAINGALAAATSITGAAANFSLNVMSKAKTNADFATGFATAVSLKDATGTADKVSVNVTINDGNNDATADGNVLFTTSTTIAGVENINIASTVATLDTGLKANAYNTTFTSLVVDSVKTLTLTGDSDIVFTGVTNTGNSLTKVDASAATGDITLDASAITSQVAYNGSAGVDTYTATNGGSIYGAAGNDKITLVAAGKADTIIYKAASDVTFTDLNSDGKIDGGLAETITGFTTAASAGANQADVIDITTFAFSGYAKAGVNKGALGVDPTAANAFASKITDFFADAGGDRGVAFGTDGGNTYVFVDANGDGNWDAATDLAVTIVGTVNFTASDIAF